MALCRIFVSDGFLSWNSSCCVRPVGGEQKRHFPFIGRLRVSERMFVSRRYCIPPTHSVTLRLLSRLRGTSNRSTFGPPGKYSLRSGL
jgi:hypothetical protein